MWRVAFAALAAASSSDLLSQEITALEEVIASAQSKVEVLKGLKAKLGGSDVGGLSEAAVQLLTAPLPPVESLPVRAHTSADDQMYLQGRFTVDKTVRAVKFLPLKSTGSGGSGVQFQALVVAVHDQGVTLYAPSGAVLGEYATPTAPVAVAASPALGQDELFLVILQEKSLTKVVVKVRAARLTMKEKEVAKAEGRSTYLLPEANVSVKEEWTVLAPGPKATTVQPFSSRGTKYIAVGDSEGTLHLYGINGTSLGGTPATDEADGVLSIGYVTSTVYRTRSSFGFFTPEEQMTQRPCPKLEGLTSAVQGVGPGPRILAYAGGELRSFHTKDRTQCTSDWSLKLEPVELFPFKSFVLGVTDARLLALNVSTTGADIRFERDLGPVRSWDAYRRSAGGGLFTFVGADQRTIEVWDMLLTEKLPGAGGGGGGGGGLLGGDSDSFSNMKMPIFGVALILVLGYQYMKFNRGSGSKGRPGRGLADLKNLAAKKRL